MQTDEDFSTLFDVVADETIDEAVMEDLFREILAAPSTPSPTTSILTGDEAETSRQDEGSADPNMDTNVGKEVETEIQRLFDLVSQASTTRGLTIDGTSSLPAEEGGNTALELDLGAWEASIGLVQPVF